MKKYYHIFFYLIITVLITYNTSDKNKPALKKDLFVVKGYLGESPVYGEQGGDMPESYVRLILGDRDKKYYLMYCSYSAADINKVLKLEKGSSVQIYFQKKDRGKRKIRIVQLKYQEYTLLSLDAYNNCYTQKWKGLLYIVYTIVLVLVLFIIYDIWKYFRQR